MNSLKNTFNMAAQGATMGMAPQLKTSPAPMSSGPS